MHNLSSRPEKEVELLPNCSFVTANTLWDTVPRLKKNEKRLFQFNVCISGPDFYSWLQSCHYKGGGTSDSPAGGLDGEVAGEGPARARGARHAVTADDARVLRRLFWG